MTEAEEISNHCDCITWSLLFMELEKKAVFTGCDLLFRENTGTDTTKSCKNYQTISINICGFSKSIIRLKSCGWLICFPIAAGFDWKQVETNSSWQPCSRLWQSHFSLAIMFAKKILRAVFFSWKIWFWIRFILSCTFLMLSFTLFALFSEKYFTERQQVKQKLHNATQGI